MSIKIDISVGELLDKITILQIKSERMDDPAKLENVNKELKVLNTIWQASEYAGQPIQNEIAELKMINESLWEIEDAIRDKERDKQFDAGFVELARSVYVTNDKRAGVKKRINLATGSVLVEEKSYQDY